MKLHELIPEPQLEFGTNRYICPRAGIAHYGVYDTRQKIRKDKVFVGAVGTSEGLAQLNSWLERCRGFIPPALGVSSSRSGKEPNAKPNLRFPFYGFNTDNGFRAQLVFGEEITRPLNNKDIRELLQIEDWNERVNEAVDLYFNEAKYLNDHRNVDVIVCVIPDDLYDKIAKEPKSPGEETLADQDNEKENYYEQNFRRALKARCIVALEKPLQLVREKSLKAGGGADQQDDATKAWNFCTALYYKARTTIPWKLISNVNRPAPCHVGICFFRSRDRKSQRTSLAQIFDELGQGVILRGAEVDTSKDDPRPYLNEQQANDLLERALAKYEFAVKTRPGRLVLHKTSNYRADEVSGFAAAAAAHNIDIIDFVTVLDSSFRLFRKGIYPPYRGTHLEIDSERHVLYTRGSVKYYQTYTGRYPPQPIEIRLTDSSESPHVICEEILGLSKMNWNNTQFDGKYPITIGCARKVGQIMKYLEGEDDEKIKTSYCYYM